MEQPVGDPHSIRDEEIEIEVPQPVSPGLSPNSSMAFQSQGQLDAHSPREGSPLYPRANSQKKTSTVQSIKPENVKKDNLDKYCFGLLDKKDGCCVNFTKIILITLFFPFICVYLSVKGIYRKCLVPACQAFDRCFSKSFGTLYKGFKWICKACQVCISPFIKLYLCIEKCLITTVRKICSCVKGFGDSIVKCVRPVTDCIGGAFMKVFKCIKYVYVNFCELLCMGFDGLFKCISKSGEMICKYPEMCCDKLYEMLVKIGEGIKKVWSGICEGIGRVIEGIVDYVLAPIFKGIYKILFAPIINLFKAIGKAINKSIIQPVVKAVKKLLKSVGNCFESNSNNNNNNNDDDEEDEEA